MDKSELELKKLQADIDKAELEKQKLTRDLNSDKPFTDKNRFWAETFRLVSIALITASASFLFTSQTESKKANYSIALEEYKEFISYKREFKDPSKGIAYKTDIACMMLADFKQIERPSVVRFLSSIASVCKDSSLLIAAAKAEHKSDAIKETIPRSLRDEMTTTEKKSRQLLQEIVLAKGDDKTKLQQEQRIFNNRLDSLVKINTEVPALSKSSELITTQFKNQAKIINEQVSLASDQVSGIGYPRTEWFKVGYFLAFDDMKIVLENIIDKQSIQISVCASVSTEVCPEEKKKKINPILTTKTPLEIVEPSAKYIIRLEHVGSAGKNPFTKAAYITIEKIIN